MTDPKPTGNEDFDLLIKCMGMTTVEEDTMALVAIRRANALLEKKGFTWDALLRGRVKIIADPYAAIAPTNGHAAPMAPSTTTRRANRTGAPMAPPPPPPSNPMYTQSRPSVRPNQYPGPCHLCGAQLMVGSGMLPGTKNAKGNFHVECLPNRGCKAPGYVPPKRPRNKGSSSKLADMI